MVSLLTAIGSIGTFSMAIIYLFSYLHQRRQMRVELYPVLSFGQLIIELTSYGELKFKNNNYNNDTPILDKYITLVNDGGGGASKISITFLKDDETIQEVNISKLSGNSKYIVPLNYAIIDLIEDSIIQNQDTRLTVKFQYNSLIKNKKAKEEFDLIITEFPNAENLLLYEVKVKFE